MPSKIADSENRTDNELGLLHVDRLGLSMDAELDLTDEGPIVSVWVVEKWSSPRKQLRANDDISRSAPQWRIGQAHYCVTAICQHAYSPFDEDEDLMMVHARTQVSSAKVVDPRSVLFSG